MGLAVLRKGLVVLNSTVLKKGIVIDWGTTRARHRDYLPAQNEDIDAVRVWTLDDIEVWPLSDIFPEESS